ncbi:hypothetical protein [Vibrio metschnikovii]|uniref:Uncharacterized protein n=1 Tax=bacterium 19MO02SH05 TaxID=2920696 RepID=A0AAU6TNT5_UNCXX|nr:hypothetical protein [Vibrio metschnikovii]EKO3719088.1 hypothetical protein [Vibrio metschnikovii]
MTKKEAMKKMLVNLFVITPLGAALFGVLFGVFLGTTVGVITVIIQVIFRVYIGLKEYRIDMKKVRSINHV